MEIVVVNSHWFLDLWNALVGAAIAGFMFHWGRKYERRQIEKEKESPWWEPKEPTL